MKSIIVFFTSLLLAVSSFGQVIHKNHEIVYVKGTKVFINKGESLMIAASLKETSWGLQVDLKIENASDKIVNVLFEDLSATHTNKRGKVKPMQLYTYNEIKEKREKHLLWFGPSNYSSDPSYSRTEVRDSNGKIVGTTNTRTSNSVYTGELDKSYEKIREVLKSYFRDESLGPGEQINVFVVGKNPKNGLYTFRLKNGFEIFEYSIQLDK